MITLSKRRTQRTVVDRILESSLRAAVARDGVDILPEETIPGGRQPARAKGSEFFLAI
jgi:hypothetical protein